MKPLPVEDAISKGVNFLSESFVFTVAGTIILIEYNRNEKKNAEKAKIAQEKEERDIMQLGSLWNEKDRNLLLPFY